MSNADTSDATGGPADERLAVPCDQDSSPRKRVAVVTGACGGLGRATVEALTAAGCEVLACDISAEPDTPWYVRADVADPAANEAAVAEAVARFGQLDIVVLNAGVQHVAPIDEFPLAEWDRLFEVMVRGPFAMIRAAWPHLTRSCSGRIIAVTSTNARLAEQHKAAYVSAKHALMGLVRVAALEGAPHGITANAVAPGAMLTPLVENQIAAEHDVTGIPVAQIEARWSARHMAQRMIDPAEVAAAVSFLASPSASAITGASVPVDLGKTAF